MTHRFAELKLLLRDNLFLDLDEHALMNSKQEGLVCDFLLNYTPPRLNVRLTKLSKTSVF